MKFIVGCDLEEFKRYYRKLALDKEWQGTFGFTEELDTNWEKVLAKNPSLLFVWRENDESLVMQSGMKLALMNIEREIPETKKTKRYRGSFVMERKTIL